MIGNQRQGRGRTPQRRWVVFLALCLMLSGPAMAAEGKRHRDWVAACLGDGSGLCYAETKAKAAGGASHLRVTRDAEGRARDVALTTGLAGLADDAPLSLRVDGKAPLSIRHASAVGQNAPQRYRLQDPGLVKKLVTQMKAGRRLQISYRDKAGQEQSAAFSLMGLTAALRSFQGDRPAAGPQGPPDLYPPPRDDGRPETQAKAQQEGARFTPAGETPPVGGCYEHQRLHDDKGYFIGWSSTYLC